jgi:hypothetical protein
MNNTSHFRTVIVIALSLVCVRSVAQDCRFFRVVSTQAVQIVSLDATGLLVWSNSLPNALCQIESTSKVDGAWTINFPTSPVHNDGSLAHVRVPLSNYFRRWIVGFQPGVTLQQAEALFDANQIVWKPLAFDVNNVSLTMALIFVPPAKEFLSSLRESPLVSVVEADGTIILFQN